MRHVLSCLAMAALSALFTTPVSAEDRMLSHSVYFSLTDNSDAAKDALIAACKKYLSDHPGTVWFAAGKLAPEFAREVNDRDFDVALLLVFKDKAAHDRYQSADKHQQFIAQCKGNWKKVRVFDAYVEAAPAPACK